jgi:anti-sigma regulatory factor (Ser/Thr protein kinase)
VRLHGGALAPSEARDMIDSWRGQIDEPLLPTVKLLVSELVTNRVALTGCSSVGLVLTAEDERIRVTVSEHGHPDVPPDPNGAGRSADWGIHLVEGLADRWDVEDGDEPQVWFEIERHSRPAGHPSA